MKSNIEICETAKEYFENNKKVYGVSSKSVFGRWEHDVFIFRNLEVAHKWLNREQKSFREREILSYQEAIKIAGKRLVDDPVELYPEQIEILMEGEA